MTPPVDRQRSQRCEFCGKDIGWAFRTSRWELIGAPGYRPDLLTCPAGPEGRHEPRARTLRDELVVLNQSLHLAVEDHLRQSRVLDREAPAGPWDRGAAHGHYSEAVAWRDRVARILADFPAEEETS